MAMALAYSCTKSTPKHYRLCAETPDIYPDYKDVTIPPNIAPLNFELLTDAKNVVVRLSNSKGNELIVRNKSVKFSLRRWHKLLAATAGDSITVEVFTAENEGWKKFRPFVISVATDSIDRWLSYRLIRPSYVAYEELTIEQRNLENFKTSIIYSNMLLSDNDQAQCINCHNYQNYSSKNMQFHARQNYGGTMIVVDGKPMKVDLKTDSTLSAGVYPSWHPRQKVIAYSVNSTGQNFHTLNPQKVEVQDSHSDLILYDIEKNTVQKIAADTAELECFPFWSPAGDYLYYCSAHYTYRDSLGDALLMDDFEKIKYNLYRMPYDTVTHSFGTKELVFDAAALGKSATLPRISPDGRFLVFTLGDYGIFHIWHTSSDLWAIDLSQPFFTAKKLEKINSQNVESYHSFSSNGRWMVVSSRREDGNYTRPYIAYFKDGKAEKPFVLPQENPEFYTNLFRSFNIPEFMTDKVSVSPQTFARKFKETAKKASYISK